MAFDEETDIMKKAMLCLALIALISSPLAANVVDLAKSSGVKGGIIVHLGCGDGRDTAKLLLNERFLVHGLDADGTNVAAARKTIQAAGLYGKVSVAALRGAKLPYADNVVNLLMDSTGGKVAKAEILRVLVPGGAAYVGGQKIVKPRPDEIDEWMHYLHGPDNNAVANDTRIDIPRTLQWVSGPRWGRSHEEMASMSAAVAANGRVFFIVDEAPLATIRFLGDWKLVARDAFNGTLLWKKPISPWNDHLRHFRSGPTHLPRRLVAVGETVYVTPGFTSPVIAADAATGKTLREYKGTERTEEIVVDGGVLFLVVGTSEANRRGGGLYERGEPKPSDFRFIAAMDAESGRPLWKKPFTAAEYLLPLTLAVKGPRLYYQSSQGMVCLDAKSGKQQWKTPRQTPSKRMAFSSPTLVATDEVVLCADRDAGKGEQPSAGGMEWGVHGWNEGGFARKGPCTLRAYAADDGKELWSTGCTEGYNSPVDVFVIDGVVWVGTGFKGLDLKTGEEVGQINTSAPKVGMPHHRCYRDKASTRFIFTGKSGIEVLSVDQKKWLSNNSWIRGTCQYGILPANGLLYAPPDACACFLTVKAPGFIAAGPQTRKTGHLPFPDQPVLEKGPSYGKPIPQSAIPNPQSDAWPMYRCNAARGGDGGSPIPDAVRQEWTAKIGGKLTQPVIAGGKAFVASVDAHTVYALAADSGREVWRFIAGGRVDSSPTIYKSTVLFGSADGWVYCVGSADGGLIWRFQAAPEDRLVGAYGQLESVWPVHGSVLVQNDTLYVTAGRSSYMDGGIVLYRIDPATGKQLSRTMLYHLDPETGKQLTVESGFNMDGTTSDILTGDGENVYLKYFAFDREGKRTEEAKPHLFAIAGLLGEEWFVRSYWIVGQGKPSAGWGGWARAANAFPAGRILCFDDDNIYGYGRTAVAGGPTGHRMDTYHLFAAGRRAPAVQPTPAPQPKAQPGKKAPKGRATRAKKPAAPKKGAPLWSQSDSLIARAMAKGGDRLAVVGPIDLGKKTQGILAFENEAEARAGFSGAKGVFLRIVSAADGKTISQCKIPTLPVFDGMAAAGGKIYISLKDGSVVCYGK